MASASEEVPASPRLLPGTRVTLHLYLASGEFVAELKELTHTTICRFAQDLEEGLITPEFDLEYRFPFDREYCYLLTWNGHYLLDGRTWSDFIRDHGMSVTEPNDIIVVTAEIADVVRAARAADWGT